MENKGTKIKPENKITDPNGWRKPHRCPICDDEDWKVKKKAGRLYCTFCWEDVTPILTD